MIKTILVPTDFSENAQSAVNAAGRLARKLNAELVLLHVAQIPNTALDAGFYAPPILEDADEVRAELQKQAEALNTGSPVTVRYELGGVVTTIKDIASEVKADVVVMGIRGSNRLSQIVFGSTTTSVMESGVCPVLVIPENLKSFSTDRIVLGVDEEGVHDKKVIDRMRQLAHDMQSELLILHVVTGEHASIEETEPYKRPMIDSHFTSVHTRLHFEEAADVMKGIDNFALKYNADVVAMFHRKHGLFHKLFYGSHTSKMAFYTRLPLLVCTER